MHDAIRQLSAEVRAAIVERLCSELDLDEEDLRALIRQDIEESMVEDSDAVVRERLKQEAKDEIYEEVHEEIYDECFERLMEHYRADPDFISQVQAELRTEFEEDVIAKLRSELREQVLDLRVSGSGHQRRLVGKC